MQWQVFRALVEKILKHKNTRIHFQKNVTYFLLGTDFEAQILYQL